MATTEVRVIRLIEYVYKDQDVANADMAHWNAPAIGVHSPHGNMTLRSTILTMPWDSEVPYEEPATTNGSSAPGVAAGDLTPAGGPSYSGLLRDRERRVQG